jgi:dihydroorotate dehydrogenase
LWRFSHSDSTRPGAAGIAPTMSYRLIRPLLFALDAERAHNLSIAALRLMPVPAPITADPMLATTVAGICFPNPVGLAAGYDKDGRVAHKMHGLGFGFAELGTLTPLAQPGNPQPRLFRLVEDKAVINRFGFNNGGQGAAADRIARYRRPVGEGPVIGINIGANKEATAAGRGVADYVTGVTCMAPLADYLTVNISSPNTPGLRALQDRAALDQLLGAVMAARGADRTPIFLKVAPDLAPADMEDIAAACIDHGVDALIVSNTSLSRPALRSPHGNEAGGLSGAPLTDLSLARLKEFRRLVGARLPLIGVGGIANADQAYARIRAGASLVQLYSALVYEGPYLARRINAGLKALMARDGVRTVADLVGVDA